MIFTTILLQYIQEVPIRSGILFEEQELQHAKATTEKQKTE